MKLLFKVDQVAALRAGINAPSSTVTLDVDPALLTQIERDVLAAIVVDGFDCTQKSYEGFVISLVSPTLEGLKEDIRELLIRKDNVAKEKEVEALERQKLYDSYIIDELNKGEEQKDLWFDRNGNHSTTSCTFLVSVVWPHYPYTSAHSYASPSMIAMYEKRREEVEAQRKAIVEAQLPEVRRQLAEKLRIEETVAEEYASLYERLPKTLRDRHVAGYAYDTEIEREIHTLILQDAGYSDTDSFQNRERLHDLTDEEFVHLKEIEAKAPKKAKVIPYRMWDEDEDGEVTEDDIRVASIKWSRGGVEVEAIISL